jgi:hypothetical protein
MFDLTTIELVSEFPDRGIRLLGDRDYWPMLNFYDARIELAERAFVFSTSFIGFLQVRVSSDTSVRIMERRKLWMSN